jgi:hypothetical protein
MGLKRWSKERVRKAGCGESRLSGLEQGKGVSPTYCYTVFNEQVLNSVQPWPRSFTALCHYTNFGMASAWNNFVMQFIGNTQFHNDPSTLSFILKNWLFLR